MYTTHIHTHTHTHTHTHMAHSCTGILLAPSDLSLGDAQKAADSIKGTIPYVVGTTFRYMNSSDAKPTHQLAVCKSLVSVSCSQDPDCLEVEENVIEERLERKVQLWHMSMSIGRTPTSSTGIRCPPY